MVLIRSKLQTASKEIGRHIRERIEIICAIPKVVCPLSANILLSYLTMTVSPDFGISLLNACTDLF